LESELAGPVGEQNLYRTAPRGRVLCVAPDLNAALRQISAALATGNRAVVAGVAIADLPPSLAEWVSTVPPETHAPCDAVLFSGSQPALLALLQRLAAQEGPIVPVYVARPDYPLDGLVQELSISTNTAAAGGNANLMTIG
jgi:RHH-type proline utilization regulon transcriptional repressor/proline dehydrogenase/delta 1-pyrroline-5-carboxylate dehydrogenase